MHQLKGRSLSYTVLTVSTNAKPRGPGGHGVLSRQSLPGVSTFESWIADVWWRMHIDGENLSRDSPTWGNATHGRQWKPRPHVGAWASLKLLLMLAAAHITTAIGDDTETAQIVQCYAILALFANLGFAYTSFVTTARDSWFRGRHGGFRDALLVNALLPAIALWSLAPHRHLLFPSPHRSLAAPSWEAAQPQALLVSPNDTLLPEHPLTRSSSSQIGHPVSFTPPGADAFSRSIFALPLILRPTGATATAVTTSADPDALVWWGALAAPEIAAVRAGDGVAAPLQPIPLPLVPGGWAGVALRLVQAAIVPVYPVLVLGAGFSAGLHALYATRALKLDGSISGKVLRQAVADSDVATLAAAAVKLGLVAGAVRLHVVWLVAEGLFCSRMALYGAFLAALWAASGSARERYYVHVHHWFVGLVLTPLCHGPDWGVALFLCGVATGQLVEGAARWSCAPLWHRHTEVE